MRNIVLFDSEFAHNSLLPLSYTRPVSHFRVGIFTIEEKWKRFCPEAYISTLAIEWLQEKYVPHIENDSLFVDSSILPDRDFVDAVYELAPSEALVKGDDILAYRGTLEEVKDRKPTKEKPYPGDLDRLRYVYNIFQLNGNEIRQDYRMSVSEKRSLPVPEDCLVIGSTDANRFHPGIFIGSGARLHGCTLNPTEGPIYIGENAEIMEGACLRGPVAVCAGSKVNMGCKIYPDTTIGPWSKVGGELNNAVIFGYSNKAHDGFLGNAVIGEWCNIGAGTNASNLKNDYSKIRIWNYQTHSFMRTDLQFCGLIMGDHSKAGINCMFNTATVVGVGVNFHGAGFPRPFIPSFSKGSCAGFTDVDLNNFFDVASKAMARRNVLLSDADKRMFEQIFRAASKFK